MSILVVEVLGSILISTVIVSRLVRCIVRLTKVILCTLLTLITYFFYFPYSSLG